MGSAVVSKSSVLPCQTTLPCRTTRCHQKTMHHLLQLVSCIITCTPPLLWASRRDATPCQTCRCNALGRDQTPRCSWQCSRSTHLVQEHEPVHSSPDGGVLVSDHDVGSHACHLCSTALACCSSHLQGPDEVLHHSGGHRIQTCCGLVVHDHLHSHSTCQALHEESIASEPSAGGGRPPVRVQGASK